jgi:hypothetical protein
MPSYEIKTHASEILYSYQLRELKELITKFLLSSGLNIPTYIEIKENVRGKEND